jgi:hypothetical protein
MRKWVVLAATALAFACSDGSGPDSLGVEDVRGSWAFVRGPKPTGCTTVNEATYYFTVPGDAVALEGGAVNVVEDWDFVRPPTHGWTVTGNFNVKTRMVELNFWHTLLDTGAEFNGTLEDDGTVSGTLRDPKPGYDAHTTAFGACSFSMIGTRN